MKRIVKATFDAAHFIRGHPKCGETHGHTYHLTVKFPGNIEVFVDFKELEGYVKKAIEPFDHHNMGHMTCEMLAKRIGDALYELYGEGIELTLFETPKFGVKYP